MKYKSFEEVNSLNNINMDSIRQSQGRNCFSLFSDDDRSLENILKFIEEQMIEDGFDKVAVVTIIGRSVMNCINSKGSLIGSLVEQNVFLSDQIEDTTFIPKKKLNKHTSLYKDKFAQIDGYYDASNRIMFLHLTSTLDSWSLTNSYKELQKQFSEKCFLNHWPNLSLDLMKSLILIFHISHIVIVSNQTPRFDISCINMFRIVDSLRVKLQPFVTEMLQSIPGISPHWIKTGRHCVPQLLFLFEALDGFGYINKSNVHYYVKQLEDQISRVLRKSRLIGMTANSLFSVSSSFVFISTQNSSINDYNRFFFDRIHDRCNNDDQIETNNFANKYYSTKSNQRFFCFLLPHITAIINKAGENDSSNTSNSNNSRHNSMATNEVVKAVCLIKVLSALKELIFEQSYSTISTDKSRNLQKIFDSLFSTLDIDHRFSEGRCSKMVMNAVNFYQENLPSHYTRETHERKLMHTLQYFTMQSRGSSIHKYIKIIQTECDKVWNNGRKTCEELSLTGNYCVHKVHRLPHDDVNESGSLNQDSDLSSSKNLPIMFHSSMAKIISACNCGRRQSNREDPFTVKSANHDFYLKMKFKCHTCRHIGQIKFPVYDNFDIENLSSSQNNMTGKSDHMQQSPLMKTMSESAFSQDRNDGDGDDSAAHDVMLSPENVNDDDDLLDSPVDIQDDNYIVTCGEQQSSNDEVNDQSKNSFFQDSKAELFLSQSSDNDEDEDEIVGEEDDAEDDDDEVDDEDEDFGEKPFLSEEDLNNDDVVLDNSPDESNRMKPNWDISTLPSMIHTSSGLNLPARFASWSLVCLGSSSIYSHNLGIQDQQGFINGSHYLLPWNVTVMLQHARNMPPLWEGKRPPGIKHKKTLKDGTQFTVKIFIGVEYECLRGHRFIASGPDHILKTHSNIFSETANKIATNDMPIYTHCICSRPGKSPTLAQLMRIHIVTPKAPIHVTLNPFVQMTPNGSPLFFPGNNEPINLSQSSYWVLRLPMIYETEEFGPISWPKDGPSNHCRLLKNCYGIADLVSKVKV